MSELLGENYKVFVSHGSDDLWVACQVSKELELLGVSPFLDQRDIPKGAPNFKTIIREELLASQELIALFTPWSAMRSWVWIEIGVAWSREIPILAVFYGMEVSDLDKNGQGQAVLEDINILTLNDFDVYLKQLRARIGAGQS